MKKKKLQLPPLTTLRGLEHRQAITVYEAGKPPKLRFRPGTYVEYKGQLCEIMYAYRLKTDPTIWHFSLEERRNLSGRWDMIGQVVEALGCGDQTPRVVYDIFKDWWDVTQFFYDIPANGDRIHATTQQLLKSKVISSGAVQ